MYRIPWIQLTSLEILSPRDPKNEKGELQSKKYMTSWVLFTFCFQTLFCNFKSQFLKIRVFEKFQSCPLLFLLAQTCYCLGISHGYVKQHRECNHGAIFFYLFNFLTKWSIFKKKTFTIFGHF